jgi:hypothetical protein
VTWVEPSSDRWMVPSLDASIPAPAVGVPVAFSAGQLVMHWPVQFEVFALSLVKM